MREVLAGADGDGRGNGTLYEVSSADGRTWIVVQFSRLYHRSLTLFGPAETTADRCFTVDLPSMMSGTTQPRITAHDSDESCTDVAAKLVSRT